MKTVAYLRVSTRSQDLANQKLAILEFSQKRRFPIDQFIESRISSRQSPRERRSDEMLGTLEPGDRLLVSELSRLGRSLSQVIQIVGRQEVKAQLPHKIETGPPSGGLDSMARPQLDEQERRARTVGVRVTAAEAAELRERAQAARLSMGAYLRRRALGQRVRMAAELRLGAAELRELNRIGVNLNQMARELNSRAVSSPAETQAAVERVGELVAKLLAGERE